MTKAYKVVCVYDDGVKTSCTIKKGKLSITYEPDKWTVKRKYGPMVFLDKERALQFLNANFPYSLKLGYYEVWECDAQDVTLCNRVLPVDIVTTLDNETIRRRMDALILNPFLNSWWAPYGTYMASQVRLTRRVD